VLRALAWEGGGAAGRRRAGKPVLIGVATTVTDHRRVEPTGLAPGTIRAIVN